MKKTKKLRQYLGILVFTFLLVGQQFALGGYYPGDKVEEFDVGDTVGFDNSFYANYSEDFVAIQDDGKMIVGGSFRTYNGMTAGKIIRLNADLSIDETFDTGIGFSNDVASVLIQPNQDIIVAGYLSSYKGVNCDYVVRLKPNGTLDTTFNYTGTSNVYGLIKDNNDRIYVLGYNFFYRLLSDGSIDPSFTAEGSISHIKGVVQSSDGKFYVAVYSYNGDTSKKLIRLNSDGSLDDTITFGGLNQYGSIEALALDQNGKLLIGGSFSEYSGYATNGGLLRLYNNGTIDTGFINYGISSTIYDIKVDQNGKILVGGNIYSYSGQSLNNFIRLNPDGTKDDSFDIGSGGFNGPVHKSTITPQGNVLVLGSFQTYKNKIVNNIVLLNNVGNNIVEQDQSLLGFNREVTAMVRQSDGKVLVGGGFSSYKGTTIKGLVRLNVDGSLDDGFVLDGNINSVFWVKSMGIDLSGKILVGGYFLTNSGSKYLLRLNPNGSIDTGFNDGNIDYNVETIIIDGSGKILLGGDFTNYQGVPAARIIRLNSDGSRDTGFNMGAGFNKDVYAIIVQPDGKILVGGYFSTYQNSTAPRIIRLNSNGSKDTTFNAGGGMTSWYVTSFLLQPDGKIIVGGQFPSYQGYNPGYLIRLNGDGSRDTAFNQGTSLWSNIGGTVDTMVSQPDGKFIVGGSFTTAQGHKTNRIARFNSDGTVDTTFRSGEGFNGSVESIVAGSGNTILVGGRFSSYDGSPSPSIVSIDTDFNNTELDSPSKVNLISPINDTHIDNNTILSREAAVDTGAGVKGYWYQISDSEIFDNYFSSGFTTELSTTVNSLDFDTTYYWRVYAEDYFGNIGEYSDIESFYVDSSLFEGATVSINNGAENTDSILVQLKITCPPNNQNIPIQMAYGDNNEPTNWAACSEDEISYTLSEGDGTKIVYARFKDSAGNISQPVSDSIVLEEDYGNRCDAITVIPNAECRALAKLYYGTFGPSDWRYDTNWMTNTAPWYGVTQDESGHVIELDLDDQYFKAGIYKNMLDGLDYLEVLSFGGNVEVIEPYAFSSLTNLRELYLVDADIHRYGRDTFAGLYNLEHLEMGTSRRVETEQGLFRDLHNLQYLYFESSNSEDLYSGYFQGLSSLTGLDLYIQGQPKIHSYAFSGLTSMEHLDLSDNYTRYVNGIEPYAFYGMPNLKTLNLYGAKLGSLPANAFAGLSSLTGLNLEYAKVGSIHPTAFDGLTNLEELYLGDNHKLETLPSGVFDDLESLKVLDIYGGRVNGLPTGIFDNNPLLTTLTLNGNTIRELPEGIFTNNPLLETIALNDNLIEDIEPTEFTSLENVTTLAFDSNCLGVNNTLTSGQIDFLDNFPTPQVGDYGVNATRTSQKGEFQCKGAEVEAAEVCSGITIYNETACHALINFYKNMNGPNWNNVTNRGTDDGNWYGITKNASGDVVGINFNGNNLQGSLTPELFSGLEKVTYISFEGGKIPNIASGTFANMTGLSSIFLGGNSIQNIEPYAFGELPNLTDLSLQNNKLITIHPYTFAGLTSVTDVQLQKNSITEIPVNAFVGFESVVDFQIQQNPIRTIYSGSFNGMSSLDYLELKHHELEVLPAGFLNGLNTGLTYFESQHGNIRIVETGAFDGFPDIDYLAFTRNEIEQFPWEDMKKLPYLDDIELAWNNIESLPESRDWMGTGMGFLGLGHNKLKSMPDTRAGTNTGFSLCVHDNYLREIPSEDPALFGVTMITNTKEDKEYDQYEEEGEDIEENRKNKKEETETIEIQDVSMNNDSLSNNCLGVLSPLDAMQQEALDYFDPHGSRQKTYAECLAAHTETPEETDTQAPVVSGITNGNTYTTSATFTVSDNVGVTSVTLNGNNLTNRTNVTITTIGTYTLVAKDAANNTTTVVFTIKKKTTSGGGGGGYYIIPTEDEQGEQGQESTKGTDEEKAKEEVEVVVGGGTRTVTVTREIKEAYEFAKEKKITTTKDIEEFEPEGKLIRMHLAKMVSEFAKDVMGKQERIEGVVGCDNFQDMKNETEEMRSYASMACRLGLMGWEADQTTVAKNFNPRGEVNRAQFGTILSRLLRGNTYATQDSIKFYENHLKALKERGIMSVIDPDMEELRGRVVLMLYRVADKK